jgi:hypothetical protein
MIGYITDEKVIVGTIASDIETINAMALSLE